MTKIAIYKNFGKYMHTLFAWMLVKPLFIHLHKTGLLMTRVICKLLTNHGWHEIVYKFKRQYMNWSTFCEIKYMNRHFFFKCHVYDWGRFKKNGSHAHTKITQTPSPPPWEKFAVGVGTITYMNEIILRGSVKNNWAMPHNIWIKKNGHIFRYVIVVIYYLFNHLIFSVCRLFVAVGRQQNMTCQKGCVHAVIHLNLSVAMETVIFLHCFIHSRLIS